MSYCVTCDGFFFKGKDVAIIVPQSYAADQILTLSRLARKVYVLTMAKELDCQKELESLIKEKKVELSYYAVPKEIKGKEKVEKLIFLEKGKEKEIEVEGIFIETGIVSLGEFAKNLKLELDKEGYILVDENMKTSVKGIFAAGNATNFKLKQVLTAASQGAIAISSIEGLISPKK